jgi:hypothetical protein
MHGAGPSRAQAAVILGTYTIAAAGVVFWSSLQTERASGSLLAAALERPLTAAAVLAPVVIGLVVQWIGRRLWAWPYVYLVVLSLALGSRAADVGDAVYLHSSAAVWVLTVLVAESVGLALGRWLHRFVGIAFFIGAGSWVLVTGLGQGSQDAVGYWQAWILAVAGALFLLHAGFQLLNYWRSRPRPPAAAARVEPAAEQAAPPAPASIDPESAEEWTFHPLGRLRGGADSSAAEVDNKRNDEQSGRSQG